MTARHGSRARLGQAVLSFLRFPSNDIAANVNNFKITYRVHAVQRMFEREISEKKVRQILEFGEIIDDYSAEMPEPSRLLLGFQGKRPFHVVTSENPQENQITVITVYIPDPGKWKKDHRTRK
jgi:hypothetical protein